MKIENNYSLLHHNTFGIDASCARFVELASVAEACEILPSMQSPFIIIGGGSNLLLTQDYEGTVVRSDIRGITVEEQNDGILLRCGSGEVWDDVVAYAVSHGYYGAENLSLIPGDVGASAVQNIGAYGSEVADIIECIEAVEIASGEVVRIMPQDVDYSYRYSRFKTEWKNRFLITYVTYRLSRTFRPRLSYGNIMSHLQEKGLSMPTAQELRDAIIEIRQTKLPDPKVLGNAGSFFMNPIIKRSEYEALRLRYEDMPHYDVDEERVKVPAGWMIDRCGWKGKHLGRAGVHDKQALVLVNLGGAKGQDIVDVCRAIQRDVRNAFGIELHPEVNII